MLFQLLWLSFLRMRAVWSFSPCASTPRYAWSSRLEASSDDADALLAEVARLRSEISEAERELAMDRAEEEEEEKELTPEERGEQFSGKRCMNVYTAESSAGITWEEKARFASAMGFEDKYYLVDGELTDAAYALFGVAAPRSDDDDDGEELFEASLSRFRKMGLFEDVVDSDDFFATEEVGALVGFNLRRRRAPYGEPGDELRSDDVGRALWRRWKRVVADAYDSQRRGKFRESLKTLENKSDIEIIDAVMVARDKVESIFDAHTEEEEQLTSEKKTKKLERALSEVIWRTKTDDSFEAQCVLDLEKVLLRDRDAWQLLRFAWRADRARACALGLALDALLNDADPATARARECLFEGKDASPDLALYTKVIAGKSTSKEKNLQEDDLEILTEAATKLNVAAMTSQFIVELSAGLSLFAFVFAIVSLLPASDSDANLAEQRFFDPIIFGSTDNRLDQLADFDMKYGTNFLSLPHPPTDKYPIDAKVTPQSSPFNFS